MTMGIEKLIDIDKEDVSCQGIEKNVVNPPNIGRGDVNPQGSKKKGVVTFLRMTIHSIQQHVHDCTL